LDCPLLIAPLLGTQDTGRRQTSTNIRES
jgi:hypothetical protein